MTLVLESRDSRVLFFLHVFCPFFFLLLLDLSSFLSLLFISTESKSIQFSSGFSPQEASIISWIHLGRAPRTAQRGRDSQGDHVDSNGRQIGQLEPAETCGNEVLGTRTLLGAPGLTTRNKKLQAVLVGLLAVHHTLECFAPPIVGAPPPMHELHESVDCFLVW